MREIMRSVDPELGEQLAKSMREDTSGTRLTNPGYLFGPKENRLASVGQPCQVAQGRELFALMDETSEHRGDAAFTWDVER